MTERIERAWSNVNSLARSSDYCNESDHEDIKENAVIEISRSAERDKSSALLIAAPSPKGARKLYLWRRLPKKA